MIKQLVDNGRLLSLLITLLLVSGLSAIVAMPRAEDPYITGRTAMVVTPFPGASAERVEALVTEKLEDKLRELAELEETSSVSREGLSFITLKLKGSVSEREAKLVWSRARNLIEEAQSQLPAGIVKTQLDEERNHAFTMLIALRWQADTPLQPDILQRYSHELESRMRRVPATDLVRSYGSPVTEIELAVDSQKLASLGLTLPTLAQLIQQSDIKAAAGQLHNATQQMTVEVSGEVESLERIRQLPLRSDEDGSVIRLMDVADVSLGEKRPQSLLVFDGNTREAVVAVRAAPDIRIDYWTQAVEAALAEFRQQLPQNLTAEVIFSQNPYTEKRLHSLLGNIILGFALILLVLLFTLGLRSALIVATSLPLTVMFTFTVMNYYGLPVNQISLTGLVVALGIMVDNAIVMVDTIAYERRQGHSAVDAVGRALSHLWLPLLGSTLTTILAFLPIALMPGSAGEFVGGIALTVVFSLIGSFLISHTLVAGLAGRYLRIDAAKALAWWQQGVHFPRIASAFERSLAWSLHHPARVLVVVSALPMLGFWGAGHLTEQFFPTSDRDMFHIEVYLPEHASLQASRALVQKLDADIRNRVEIKALHWFIGGSAPSFYYNLIPRKDGSSFYAQAMVSMSDFRAVNRVIPQLQQELDKQFPEARILVRKLEQGPPFDAPVEIRLYGANLAVMKQLGEDVRRLMAATPDVLHTRATLADARPKLALQMDTEVLEQNGLSLLAVTNTLRYALDGVEVGSLLEATEEVPLRLRLAEFARQNPDDVASLYLLSQLPLQQADGKYAGMPLAAVAQLGIEPSRGAIPHRNGQRVNTIEAYVRDGVLPGDVLQRIRAQLAQGAVSLPAGYRLEIGGEDEKRNDAVGDLMLHVGVILTLLVVVVVLSFNSFRLSGIIFLVAVQAAGFGLLSVYSFDYPFGFTVIIGLLGLIGLAINAAIVILAELKSNSQAVQGNAQAVLESVLLCSRHISSTTITTVGGFLPLILGGGGFWPPFAVAIAGGTLLTTLVSFYFVPAAFILLARYRHFEAA